MDLQALAPVLGGIFRKEEGERKALEVTYFGEPVLITERDIRALSGKEVDPWEKILLYIYVLDGAAEPSCQWIGMESLPNSVSKVKSLNVHCEDRLAQTYAGRMGALPRAVEEWGREVTSQIEQVDFAAEFSILPRLTVRVLWWDEDLDEGFPCRVKFLFDSNVLKTVDLESLLFACEQLTDRLL